jgi:hypothetical protein
MVLAAIALGACSERPTPTQPAPESANRVITCDEGGCGGGGGGGGDPPPPPPPPAITSVSLPNSTLALGGVSVPYTATVTNDGPSLSDVGAQGYIVQGSARRAAGGTLVTCGAGTGVLPHGTCQISFIVVAGNNLWGSGTLVPGGATFELDLNVGSSTAAVTNVGVNLIPGELTASGSPMFSLSGASTWAYMDIYGGPQTISGLSYQMSVIQGSAHRSAGSMPMVCFGRNAGSGNLPPGVLCSMSATPGVTNNTSGTGTLVPGPATFQVSLLQGSTILTTRTWATTLVDVRLIAVTTSPNPSPIGRASRPFTMTVSNAGAPLPFDNFVSGVIRQGAATWGYARSDGFNCGSGVDVLPSGTCTISGYYVADTSTGPEPRFVPGPATLRIYLSHVGGTIGYDSWSARLDSIETPITLIRTPRIETVTPIGSSTIGNPGTIATYTATIDNPGPTISGATVTVKILQSLSVNRLGTAGPVSVDCGSGLGTLPSGTCTFTGSYSASNNSPGTGTLFPGPATLQIQLSDPLNGTVFTKSVSITLLGP